MFEWATKRSQAHAGALAVVSENDKVTVTVPVITHAVAHAVAHAV